MYATVRVCPGRALSVETSAGKLNLSFDSDVIICIENYIEKDKDFFSYNACTEVMTWKK